MPRIRRSVSKGVQDEAYVKEVQKEERRRKREKANTWLNMYGMTLVEFILCLICFAVGYAYYHQVQQYRNDNMIRHDKKTVRYILLPPTPLAVASVFLSLTYLDLISWASVRPITYFAWIMASTAGFLCFCLYSGVILMTNNSISSIIAIIVGILTALVFLADLVCMLCTMKRFPAPYWVLKRKCDKMDQCVCTGDCPEEITEERPLCKCIDHWGAPCICDNPDGDENTCGCGAEKTGEPPCECCECADELFDEDSYDPTLSSWTDNRQSIAPGFRQSIAPSGFRQSIAPGFRQSIAPGMGYRQSMMAPSYIPSMADSRRVSRFSTKFWPERSRSTMVGPDFEDKRKSIANQAYSEWFDATPVHDYCSQPMPRLYCTDTYTDSEAGPSQEMNREYGVPQASRIRTASQIAVVKSLQSPSHRLSVRPSMRSVSGNLRQPSMASRNRSHLAYSAYTTIVNDRELIRDSLAEKQNPVYIDKDVKGILSQSSSEEEIGHGDIPTKKIVVADVIYNPPHEAQTRRIKPRLRHTASNHPENDIIGFGSSQTITLPGQTLDSEEGQIMHKRNVSVSARTGTRSCSLRSESETRPKSTRVIRNVSTTVRTLSSVIEADNESRGQQSSSDGVPSGCTITIHK
ncbi:unnamed protein product [Ceutorhynchus assimilis]|uniref:Uncharacterized protein n=1 Tax=Ceutorhynchus assimilis TaxID=467358 RepID=A0A9N9QP31_9CUCU|nr:unnamed protein product [Ceutorhynchus assimilis]